MEPEQIIDLSLPLEEGMLTFNAPWHPHFQLTQLARLAQEGRETRRLVMGTHTGTHVDAPRHFIAGGASIDQLPLSRYIGAVQIVDCRQFGAGSQVTKNFLAPLRITARMLFMFGWDQYWNTRQYYTNWPTFTPDAAQHLVDHGIQLAGFDMPSPDPVGGAPGTASDSPAHKILLGSGVTQLEYLANLRTLSDVTGWTLIAAPLHLRGADGAPTRACLVKWKAAA